MKTSVPKHSQYDSYPFGMPMPGHQFSSNSYRYGFQGQEKDDEIKGVGNSINYRYRMDDVRLGRFFAIDPLASDYPWNSTYAFSENKVINSIELEGLESVVAIDGSEHSGPVNLYDINSDLANENPSLLEADNLNIVNEKILSMDNLDNGPYPIPVKKQVSTNGPTIGPCTDCGTPMRERVNEQAKSQKIYDSYKRNLNFSEPVLSGQFGGANQYPTIIEGASIAFGPEGLLLKYAGMGMKSLAPVRSWNEVKALRGLTLVEKGALWGTFKAAQKSFTRTVDSGLMFINVSLTVEQVSGLLTKELFSNRQQYMQQ